jgi:protein-S-isoprenylcysteine O-methyltransferase Ste14
MMQARRLGGVGEFLGKASVLALFGAFATFKAIGIKSQIETWAPESSNIEQYVDLASHVAALAFLALLLLLTVLRLGPKAAAQGWEPKASALIGTFLLLALIALPLSDIGFAWRVTAITIITVGWLLSIYVLAWLGRSFSITPQARRLVTTGPYGIVRHPLYVCEEITVIGIVLLHLSPVAILIAVVQWMFQLRRMTLEERVLKASFPEYAEYGVRTGRIIPRLLQSRNAQVARQQIRV